MEMRLRRRHRRLIFSLNAKKQPRRLGASTSLSALRAALSWILNEALQTSAHRHMIQVLTRKCMHRQ